jgi:hypothetical protein
MPDNRKTLQGNVGSDWKTVIQQERAKEHHLIFALIFAGVVVVAGFVLLDNLPSVSPTANCVNKLALYDPSVLDMEFKNKTEDGETLFYYTSENKQVVMTSNGNNIRHCELTSKEDLVFAADKKYRCDPGLYYLKTGKEGNFWVVATKAVPTGSTPFVKVKCFTVKEDYELYVNTLQLGLEQNNCKLIENGT